MTIHRILVCSDGIKQKLYMTSYKRFGKTVLASSFLLLGLQPASNAQIVPDATLPNHSAVTQTNSTYEITGGSIRNGNLFHSFEDFSVPEANTAFFNNTLTIDRIITRVTGSNRSTIEGILRANGNTDLFLINPNGIVLGPNAQLNIGGSFIASTADHIEFADGSIFSARNPSASPLLTVSVPIGLQYGSSPGNIVIQGSGNALRFDPETFVIDRSQRPEGLQANSGETLAFIGAGVTLQGGNLTSPDGRVEVGSVDANERVELAEAGSGWSLNYDDDARLQGIRLSQAASIDVSGIRGGDVQLYGRQIRIREGSSILANTQGDGAGGHTFLHADEMISVAGFSSELVGNEITPLFPSSILMGLESNATGRGGTLQINTPRLRVIDGGVMSTNNLGSGESGNLRIEAPHNVVLRGGIPALEFSSGLLADVYDGGNGGSLSIDTGHLSVTAGAEVSASTFAEGNSGQMMITADTINVSGGAAFLGASSILTSVQLEALGNAGDLVIEAERLSVSGGATVLSSTFGSGSSGDLRVSAQTIDISGVSPIGNPSGLFAETDDSNGAGGNLVIDTDVLQLSDGAQISSSTFNAGNAGDLSIDAQEINVIGTERTVTGLFAAVNSDATGTGGSLAIQAQTLRVRDGGQVVAGTRGAGNAGLMMIDVQDILLSGFNSFGQSGLFASAIVGTGAGGDMQVVGDRLVIEDGAVISASNFPSNGDRTDVGQGAAGNIQIDVNDIRVSNQGRITASTASGGRGNIAIQADRLFLANGSRITTNSQGQEAGGNITIDTSLLLAFGNSDITANAEASFGGQIIINADQIFGMAFREQLTSGNDVTATSELGSEFNGVVEINNPDIEILARELPEKSLVNPNQVVAACEHRLGNEFVVTGQGGVPADPSQYLNSQIIWRDRRLLHMLHTLMEPALENDDGHPMEITSEQNSDRNTSGRRGRVQEGSEEHVEMQRAIAPVEATRWVQTHTGEIQLVAQVTEPILQTHSHPAGACRDWGHP